MSRGFYVRECGLTNYFASVWIQLATRWHGVKEVDKMRMACTTIREQINFIMQHEALTRKSIDEISQTIKSMPATQRTKVAVLRPLLSKSRRLRINLNNLTKQRESLDRQLESLNTTALNQNVFKAMRESKDALKSMGVEVAQKDLDGVLTELDDQMYEANQLTSALSAALDPSDEMNLLEEFDLLFQESTCAKDTEFESLYTDVFPVLRSIDSKKPPAANVARETTTTATTKTSDNAVVQPTQPTDEESMASGCAAEGVDSRQDAHTALPV